MIDNLSPLYRHVVGFWRHIVEKRVNPTTGTIGSETKRSPSVIVYTPSGFVGVHFPPLNRKPFAGETPTPEEAQAALRGYIGYYGALTVYPGQVFHNILAGVSPIAGTILDRRPRSRATSSPCGCQPRAISKAKTRRRSSC